ncbi:uncharacterized protein LOC115947809 [Geospiza fortis]|uniref:Uncharacterized protein LOC115947809 n=1 Tax=Geospiza fortis TaxID=48883 RepID=A0A8N5EMB8_GEOFO|nr:uncharacterized protein LOC115947809 [Geospiza fortis]
MKKCFRAPGRVIFLCNESGFCQRKEPARSEDRRAVSFQERGPARRAAPCARDPRSLRALIHSRSRLSGAPPRALTSGCIYKGVYKAVQLGQHSSAAHFDYQK